ncbi:MAG: hypothetical protein EOP92_02315 [Lysobacteraceae bacterium]|nr:MAG: hypothetical protein EOP92_02315 [Xanthomonadaceae bacterium]
MRKLLTMMLLGGMALAACSRDQGAPADLAGAQQDRMPSQAEMDRVLADGPDAALRKIAPFDYLVHYRTMEATGIMEALGGEQRAIAALKALGNAYERKLRGAQADAPKIIPAAFDGSGMDSGFVGMGVGAFGGFIAGGMVGGAVSDMSDEQLGELVKQGPIELGGKDGGFKVQFDERGNVDQTIDFDGKVAEGLTGKVKIKVHIDACPDASGKLTVTLNVDSQMGVVGKPGVGGTVRSEFKLERFLDDDAHLMAQDGDNASMTMNAGGAQGGRKQSFDVRMGYGRESPGGYQDFGNESGFSIFHMDEVRHAAQLAEQSFNYQRLLAEMMLRGVGKGAGPWESGRCIDLRVTSSPGKRSGIKPNTAFDLEAMPRAKADGAPAGGTVTAALSGGASLQPAGGKVRADAKYAYAGPTSKDEEASIAFEARSKRGVGRATLAFDTKAHRSYHAEGGLQAFHGTGTICDLSKPFTISGGGNTVSFSPSGEAGGSYTYQGNMGGIGVYGRGTYTASADENGGKITGSGNGCVKTPMGTRCANGTERYTLTPVETCETP